MKLTNRRFPRAWAMLGSVGLVTYGVSGGVQTPAPVATAEQTTFFETSIRPVLSASCLGCHGKEVQLGGLRLDSREAIMKGGLSGPAIVPGDPEKSLLIQAIRQTGKLKMPQGGKLDAPKIAAFEAWVKASAPWPTATSTQEPKPLWSLQPVVKPAVPKVKNTAWPKNPIDSFVLAKLEASKQAPAPEADRRTLIRRVTYDLTGLPPTPAEVDAFLADKTPKAYEKVVDRLLASPRYGERWARHWMDVARYADTKGYVFEEDRTYPNAYSYRDWLIDAFNNDLPYDKFITEQLAADRLPEVRDGDDKRPLAALGFLTVGRRFLNSQPDIIDDRIDVTMRGFQAFTVGCARCHDHKFDPIPTQDYYSLYAVFASSEEVVEPISEKPIREPWIQFNQQVASTEDSIRTLSMTQTKRLREIEKSPNSGLSDEVKQVLKGIREETVPDGDNLKKLAKAFEPAESERLGRLQKSLGDLKANAPRMPKLAMAMHDRANPGDGVIFKRGNPGNPGDPAPRRFLKALSKPNAERDHWTKDSGRLELAQSIASRENPLTARVFVNRLWQDNFGAAIVRTPSDFGHQGEKPTDPKLLDYLATTFMDNGWSIKKLQRLIVTSATYRQSSDVSKAAFEADPDNRNWGRMNRRRLDLEQMRDSLVFAAGKLDTSQTGGKSVDLWSQPFTDRRAMYGFIERQNLPGIFRTFDFASPDSTNARRFQTTVPQQALFFMNSPFSVEQAKALVSRPDVASASTDAQRVQRLYRLLFDRAPDSGEQATGIAYLSKGAPATVGSEWQYGYGKFDGSSKRVSAFTPMNEFAEGSYRVGKAFPDPQLGYLILNPQGGHPGHDGDHAVIRRWVAPAPMTVQISGALSHSQSQGDGVRARVVSSRAGLMGEWQAHNGSSKTDVAAFAVQKGDTIDFVVDPISNDGYDAFGWSPVIRSSDGKQVWDASAGFSSPAPAALSRLVLYAQALMMTNEFMFID